MYSRELGDMSTQFRDSVIDAGRTAKSGNKTSCLVKTGVQALHILIGLGFLILALYEFILNPPYFDVVGYTRRQNDSLFNATRDATGEIRRVMDLPIFLLFIVYFIVLIWKKGWGVWSFLMTVSVTIVLFVFVLVNYFAPQDFDWRFFSSRSYGILIHVFSFALGWDCVVSTVFTRIEWFPFTFLSSGKPRTIWEKVALVLWNFFIILVFLFFCLLIWFSRLYYSWACVRSLDDVLLMCQFTDLVQCYSCEQAEFCRDLKMCINTAKLTFHCQTPLGLLHKVENALCIFNYNIGFFTFIMVFAYVGGTYFFFLGVTSFLARLIRHVTVLMVKFMNRKTKPHIEKAYRSYSVRKKRRYRKDDDENDSDEELIGEDEPENQEILKNMSNNGLTDSSDSQLQLRTAVTKEHD